MSCVVDVLCCRCSALYSSRVIVAGYVDHLYNENSQSEHYGRYAMKRPVGKLFVHLFAITGIAGTDLYIKKQIEEKKEMNCCEPICRGKLLLRRYHNRGAFLNLGEKNPQLVAAISVGMTVLAGLFFLSTFSFLGKGMLRWGLTMLLGGAFSNTYDRLKRKYVVDYVSFNVPWEAFRKIVFNIGDFAIMIGALVSVLSEV